MNIIDASSYILRNTTSCKSVYVEWTSETEAYVDGVFCRMQRIAQPVAELKADTQDTLMVFVQVDDDHELYIGRIND